MKSSFHTNKGNGQHAGQAKGVSLIIVLMFLVILSGLAVTAIQGSSFASRIAANEADRTLAFQAAEAALRDAEYDIRGLRADGVTLCADPSPATHTSKVNCRVQRIYFGDGFNTTCPLGRCVRASPPPVTPPDPVWEIAANWSATSVTSVIYGENTGALDLPVVSRQPRYMIEYFKQGDVPVYRITAVGFGANESTQAVLQSAIKGKTL
jgi:type IV pilus assembly protein PilX